MDIEQLKTDLAAGTLSTEKLLAVIVAQQKRIAELEAIINGRNPTPVLMKLTRYRQRSYAIARKN